MTRNLTWCQRKVIQVTCLPEMSGRFRGREMKVDLSSHPYGILSNVITSMQDYNLDRAVLGACLCIIGIQYCGPVSIYLFMNTCKYPVRWLPLLRGYIARELATFRSAWQGRNTPSSLQDSQQGNALHRAALHYTKCKCGKRRFPSIANFIQSQGARAKRKLQDRLIGNVGRNLDKEQLESSQSQGQIKFIHIIVYSQSCGFC